MTTKTTTNADGTTTTAAETTEATDNTPKGDAGLDAVEQLQRDEDSLNADGLAGDQGEEVKEGSEEMRSAMLAGWKRANGKADATTVEPKDKKTEGEDKEGDDKTKANATGEGGEGAGTTDDDPEVPGLGMKASEVRARLGKMDALEKSVASTAGHLGHLKTLVTNAGKGKAITREQLKNVANEFGEEYADALAKDLGAAGFGGGASVDPATISQMVSEQVAAATQRLEKANVMRAHRDAEDHFYVAKIGADGKPEMTKDDQGREYPVMVPKTKKAEAFAAFVRTLPKERQEEIATSWDSSVVIGALDEFKASEKKAADAQAKQNARTARAVMPTASRGAVVQPVMDPLREGWNRVRGNQSARR